LSFDLPTLLRHTVAGRAGGDGIPAAAARLRGEDAGLPLHTWLPLLAMEGPVAIAALLTGLKLGAYGLIRFAVPLAPNAAQDLHWLLAGLGVVGMIFGALAAMAQTNLRACWPIPACRTSAWWCWASPPSTCRASRARCCSCSTSPWWRAALSWSPGSCTTAPARRTSSAMGGAAKTMPLLAGFLLSSAWRAWACPAPAGFPAELLILMATLQTHTGAGLAALFAMVLGAAYFLDIYRRAFFGPVTRETVARAGDLRPRELALVLLFAGLILFFGLFPALLLELIQPSAAAWAARLR
jgi:NADH-quinone oxidoreductase subunit M